MGTPRFGRKLMRCNGHTASPWRHVKLELADNEAMARIASCRANTDPQAQDEWQAKAPASGGVRLNEHGGGPTKTELGA